MPQRIGLQKGKMQAPKKTEHFFGLHVVYLEGLAFWAKSTSSQRCAAQIRPKRWMRIHPGFKQLEGVFFLGNFSAEFCGIRSQWICVFSVVEVEVGL